MLLYTMHPHLQAVTPSSPSSLVFRWKQRFGYPWSSVSQAHKWAELGPCWGGQHETHFRMVPDDQGNVPQWVGIWGGWPQRGDFSGDPCSQDMSEGRRGVTCGSLPPPLSLVGFLPQLSYPFIHLFIRSAGSSAQAL